VEEQARTNWASHDVGRILGGQSLVIHHFQEPQVAMRCEEAQRYQGLAELGKCRNFNTNYVLPRLS
jgi:hypothetical protein